MPPSSTDRFTRARSTYAALVRFSERREAFLDALDWEALDPGFVRETSMADDQLSLDLADAWLLVDHLEERLADES